MGILKRFLIVIVSSFSILSLLMMINIFNILFNYIVPSNVNCHSWSCNSYAVIYKIIFFPSEYHKTSRTITPYLELLKIFITTAAGTIAGFQLLVTRDEKLRIQLSEAITLINDNERNVRIQGIYLLTRISLRFPEDKQFIITLISLFIRESSPFNFTEEEQHELNDITNDIQTALSELFRIKSKNIKIDLSSSNLKKATFSFLDLRKTNFANSNFKNAYFYKTNLSQTSFKSAHFGRINFSNARINKADFIGAHLEGAIFSSNNHPIKNVNFQHAHLQGAKFEGTIFDKNVIFDHATLVAAQFITSILKKVSFKQCGLQKANFEGADLEGANFEGADLKEANLKGAKNIVPEQIKMAKNWELAEYDSEFRRKLGLL